MTNPPPNETLVEVHLDGETLHVMAIYGRDGVQPHWCSADGMKLYPIETFTEWREIVFPGRRHGIIHPLEEPLT